MNAPTLAALLVTLALIAAAPRAVSRKTLSITALTAAAPGIISTYLTPHTAPETLGGIYLICYMLTALALTATWLTKRTYFYPRNRRARDLTKRRLQHEALSDEAARRYLTDPDAVYLPQPQPQPRHRALYPDRPPPRGSRSDA